jgi:ADP-ribose pyrophosphatase
MDNWSVAEHTVAFEHPWVRIMIDRLARGDESRMYYYLESPVDSVNMLAVTANREIVLTRQYRHPIGQIIYDLPAGRADPGEDPLEGARRELEEETGYHAGTILPLGSFNPFPGSLKVTAHLFFAADLTPGHQRLDPGEELEVHLRPFDEVYAEVLTGQHVDAALQMAVLLARGRGLA